MLAILACALFLRILIPQGWMPVQTAQGWRLTLCSGTGPMRLGHADGMPAMKGMHHPPRDQSSAPPDQLCPFSSLAQALDEPPLPVLDLPRLFADVFLADLPPAVGIGRGLAAPPPPATGPPSIA